MEYNYKNNCTLWRHGVQFRNNCIPHSGDFTRKPWLYIELFYLYKIWWSFVKCSGEMNCPLLYVILIEKGGYKVKNVRLLTSKMAFYWVTREYVSPKLLIYCQSFGVNRPTITDILERQLKKKPKKTPLPPPLLTMLEFTTKINWLKSSTLLIGGEGRGAEWD